MTYVKSCLNIGEPPSNIKNILTTDSEKYRKGKTKDVTK